MYGGTSINFSAVYAKDLFSSLETFIKLYTSFNFKCFCSIFDNTFFTTYIYSMVGHSAVHMHKDIQIFKLEIMKIIAYWLMNEQQVCCEF